MCVIISSATLTCLLLVSYKQYIAPNGIITAFYVRSEMQEYENYNSWKHMIDIFRLRIDQWPRDYKNYLVNATHDFINT
jgi:hypothetical protein